VDKHFVTAIGTFPAPQTLLRENGRPEVYWMTPRGGLHIPSPAAMDYLRLPWDQIRTIPAGTVRQIRPYEQASNPQTPPSMVFDRNANNNGPDARSPRTELPGDTLPNGNHIVGLYGWMVGTHHRATPMGREPTRTGTPAWNRISRGWSSRASTSWCT
jgi:hypothetical protein